MSDVTGRRVETNAVHAGREVDPATGAIVPPIHLSTTFEREADGSYPRGFDYAKFGNPNRSWLEKAITDLEGGDAAVATSSGMAAIASVLSALEPGDRVLVSYDVFQGTARLLNDQLKRWGVVFDVADTSDLASVERRLTPRTRLIWVDTPSNPLLRVTDIAGVVALAKPRHIWVAVDTTFATFVLQRPLALGADVAVYAATKYVAGHSDVVGGLAVFRERGELYQRSRAFQINVGATLSPFDCWMVHRGLRTLPLRMAAHSRNGMAVAEALLRHRNVEKVCYPGLAQHEQHAVAARQMADGYGGMLSFAVRGTRDAAIAMVGRTHLFIRGASLGGVESLIEHRASSPVQTRGTGTSFQLPENVVRLSVGIEHAEDLIADLEQALDVVM